MENMELWTAYTSQIVALTAILGVVLGTLRNNGVLTADAMEAAFRSAEDQLPDTARPAGSNLLTHLHMMTEVAAHRDDFDATQR